MTLSIAAVVIAAMSIVQSTSAQNVYSVAGEPAEVFGAYWSETNTETEMTLGDDGIYRWKAENKIFEASTDIQFKIVANHNWSTAYPVENKWISIAEAGQYDITFTFNESTQEVDAVVEKKEVEVSDNSIFVVSGSFNNWVVNKRYEMAEAGDGRFTYTLENMELDEKEVVELKVADMADPVHVKWYPSGENISFVATEAGAYDLTISFNSSSKEVSVNGQFKAGMNTYTVTWVNIMHWDEVYAYAWTWNLKLEEIIEYMGEYPGAKLEKTGTKTIDDEEYEVYTCTIRAAFAPQNIIFNNGLPGEENQTTDHAFVDGKEYMELAPPVQIKMNEYGFMPFSSKYALDLGYANGVKAYYAAGVTEDGKVIMEEYKGKAPARYGLFLVGDPNSVGTIPTTFGVMDNYPANMLVGSANATNVEPSNEAVYHYVFQTHSDIYGFYFVDKDGAVSEAGSAYIESPIKIATDENGKIDLVLDDGTILPSGKKCAKPTIAFINGTLKFSCETENVYFVSDIRVADAKRNYSDEVTLYPTYVIDVYAARDGYANSDVARATIGWRYGRPYLEGFSSTELRADDSSADVNFDGVVDVADIAEVISIMAAMARAAGITSD